MLNVVMSSETSVIVPERAKFHDVLSNVLDLCTFVVSHSIPVDLGASSEKPRMAASKTLLQCFLQCRRLALDLPQNVSEGAHSTKEKIVLTTSTSCHQSLLQVHTS